MSLAQDIEAAAPPYEGIRASTERFLSPNGRILLVDDDAAVRETLANLLEFAGFCPIPAEDAAEALALLESDPAIDAMVTDLSMPGTDGISLILQAREIRRGLPAILLTGYAEQLDAVGTCAGNEFRVLRKPIEGHRLAQQLELLVATKVLA